MRRRRHFFETGAALLLWWTWCFLGDSRDAENEEPGESPDLPPSPPMDHGICSIGPFLSPSIKWNGIGKASYPCSTMLCQHCLIWSMGPSIKCHRFCSWKGGVRKDGSHTGLYFQLWIVFLYFSMQSTVVHTKFLGRLFWTDKSNFNLLCSEFIGRCRWLLRSVSDEAAWQRKMFWCNRYWLYCRVSFQLKLF